MVVKQITNIGGRAIFDGNEIYFGFVDQTATSPGLRAYAGAGGIINNDLSLNTLGIVRVLFNGVSSKFIVNNNTPITGNCGVNNLSGFTLGARGNNASRCNIEVKEIIGRSSILGEAAIYAYLSAKYGI